MQNDLTQGGIFRSLIRFSVPYLISSFLQTFYGLADLFVTGCYNGADVITAVSVGSQVTHMLTVVIVGLAMGSTVLISSAVGAKDERRAARGIGNTVLLFVLFSIIATVCLVLCVNPILSAVDTPAESFSQARQYLLLCFAGVPFITAYNVLSSIFRGLGDSRSPMYFVAAAGVLNIFLDFLFIGPLGMKAAGAALATVLAQAISVLLALFTLCRRSMGVNLSRQDFVPDRTALSSILRVGVPVAFQDGFIQVSFLVITAIANGRGVDTAAAVGIVEKVISFLFLVPSSMLSAISVMAAQNLGAGQRGRAKSTLYCGMAVSVVFGIIVSIVCQFAAEPIVELFADGEPEVIRLGGEYLRSYVFDCIFAGIHFCFSGYFCACGKSFYSFAHNLASVLLVRIPGAYLATLWFPDTLYPMGFAPPAGSLLSALICTAIFLRMRAHADD